MAIPLCGFAADNVSPYIAINLAANLQNTTDAYFVSSIFSDGIGTLYFEAINSLASFEGQLGVAYATDMYDSVSNTVVALSTWGGNRNSLLQLADSDQSCFKCDQSIGFLRQLHRYEPS